MIAIFIDGPLKGEVKNIPPMMIYKVLLPPRVTVCYCDDGFGEEISPIVAETVEYRAAMTGVDGRVAMYSIKGESDDVLMSLKSWVSSNFQAERWYRGCRDERAWT